MHAVFTFIALMSLSSAATLDTKTAPRRIDISVTEEGFVPKRLEVKRGEPVILVFTRRTNHTCAKDVIVYVDDKTQIAHPLPLDQPVEIPVTFAQAGERGFACKMGMHGAAVIVR